MIIEKSRSITGIILAGGRSSRMGQDKGLMLHNGNPFIQYIIEAIKTITENIIIITANSDYEIFGHPCIPDIIPDQGPVGGIYTALKHSKTQKNLVLSCDVPFVTPRLLQNLISNDEPSYDIITYKDTPLISLYNKSVTHTFYESIKTKRLSLRKTISALKVKNIPIEKDILSYVKNINTPQQYKEAIQ